MSWISIEEAHSTLRMWLDAERAVATGQSYKIGTRSLTRANLADIRESIQFWRREIARLEAKHSGARVFRAVPRDL